MSSADGVSGAAEPVELVPLNVLGPDVPRPMNARLALVGAPMREIGAPVRAFSEIDLGGYAVDPTSPRATGASQWRTTILTAAAMGSVFGGLLGAIVMLVMQDATSVLITVCLVSSIFAIFVFLFRPRRDGWSAVVGTEGLQVGTVKGGRLERTVLLYGDYADAWFEEATNIFTRRPGWPEPTTPTHTTMRFVARGRESLEVFADMKFAWSPQSRAEGRGGYRESLFFALQERGLPRRVDAAMMRLARGEPFELPTLEGLRIRILPKRLAVPGAFDVEIARGGATELRVEAPISIAQGVYSFTGGGRTMRIPRSDVGDAFVLDALVLRISEG